MRIEEQSFKPFVINVDYHGLHLIEIINGGAEKKIQSFKLNEMQPLLQEVVRRKLSMLTGTVTFKEYREKETQIINEVMFAIGEINTVNQEKVTETPDELAQVEQLT